jgi:CheY-like chemotaxis protein/HPt (histidine-containing phosphotransfer) domain-containing protein
MPVDEPELLLHKPLKLSQFQALLLRLFSKAWRDDDVTGAAPYWPERPASAALPRILIAEDDHTNQQLAARILQRAGYPYTLVSTGAQVLATLEHEHYGIIFLDVQMPDLNGFETARLIRQNCSIEPQPYIIAITAGTSPDIEEQCLSAGMNYFLAKPLQIPQLYAALAQYEAYIAAPATATHDIYARAVGAFASDKAAARSHSEPLDTAVVRQVRTLFGPEHGTRLRELVETYRNDSAALLTIMRAAYADHDHSLFGQAIHKLKSSSAIVAALPLADLCKQVETAMHTSTADDWESWIQKIEAEFGRVQISLEKEFLS